MLGGDHPDTLTTRHNLGQQIGHQGRYRGTETEFRVVDEARVRVLGPDHPNNLRTRYWLAKVLDGQGRHAEADDLLAGLEAQLLAQFSETTAGCWTCACTCGSAGGPDWGARAGRGAIERGGHREIVGRRVDKARRAVPRAWHCA